MSSKRKVIGAPANIATSKHAKGGHAYSNDDRKAARKVERNRRQTRSSQRSRGN